MSRDSFLTIRPARCADLPVMADLMAAAGMEIQFDEDNCFIAEHCGIPAGFARVEYYAGKPYLRPIVVGDAFQHRGYGKAMIESILQWEDSLTVVARGSAAGFYLQLGFEHIDWAEIPVTYFEECMNCMDLEKCGPVPLERRTHEKLIPGGRIDD